MFFCDECGTKRYLPQSVNFMEHECAFCGKTVLCNDVPDDKIQKKDPETGANTWMSQMQRKLDGSRSTGTLNPVDMWRSLMGPFGFAMPPGGMPEFQIRDKDLDDLLREALGGALRGSGHVFIGGFDNPEEAMRVCQEIIGIVQGSPSPEVAMQRVVEYIQNRKTGGAPSDQGTDSGDSYGGRYK